MRVFMVSRASDMGFEMVVATLAHGSMALTPGRRPALSEATSVNTKSFLTSNLACHEAGAVTSN